MRDVFKYLTSLLFVAVVVQVALAGYGAFVSVDKSADNGSVSKQAVEHGFSAHAALGTIIVALMLLIVIVAAAGRLGKPWVHWTAGIFGLGIVQMLLAWLGSAVAALGFLHAVNALAIYAAAALLAHRAWTRLRTAPTAPA
jgi:Family of unknown function (DUF6220)